VIQEPRAPARKCKGQAREVRWYQYARRSWLQPDEIGTFGAFARILARTQRARARRDQVGKNCRDNARAWAKLWMSMRGISVVCLWLVTTIIPRGEATICPRLAESPAGLVLHDELSGL